jgi:glycolate oxidase FAD binding subunit
MRDQDPALSRLREQVRAAGEQRSPLDIRGGGSKAFYGQSAVGEPLEVRALSGISSYEPTELVVTARAGTPLAELEALLAKGGQCLPFEPPRFASGGTVGGMVAAGLAGPARARVGGVRDYVLGTTVLNGRGDVLTFGGQVIKNVAGYDVSRLMAGSLGILGVICEISLKVLPVAPATATLRFEAGEVDALKMLNALSARPLPLDASAWNQERLHLRLSGAKAAVEEACNALGGDRLEAGAAAAWWTAVRDHRHPFFHAADEAEPGECLWRLSVPDTARPLALPGKQFVEWGGALRWWRTSAPTETVRAAATQVGGHATLFRSAGDRSAGAFTPLSVPLMRIHRGLKQAFDPYGIFNPGRLYPGL